MNSINLMGRLGADPEQKKGEVITFNLATNDGKDKVNWHRCIAFKETGKTVLEYVNKGDMIGVSGRVDYSEHDGKYYTTIIVNRVTLGGKSDKSDKSDKK